MTGEYTLDTFDKHIGTVFTVALADGGTHPITLVEATAYPTQPGAPRQEPFSLVFESPTGWMLSQATYELHHDALGDLAVFLVPIGPGVEGGPMRYEAVFN